MSVENALICGLPDRLECGNFHQAEAIAYNDNSKNSQEKNLACNARRLTSGRIKVAALSTRKNLL